MGCNVVGYWFFFLIDQKTVHASSDNNLQYMWVMKIRKIFFNGEFFPHILLLCCYGCAPTSGACTLNGIVKVTWSKLALIFDLPESAIQNEEFPDILHPNSNEDDMCHLSKSFFSRNLEVSTWNIAEKWRDPRSKRHVTIRTVAPSSDNINGLLPRWVVKKPLVSLCYMVLPFPAR